MTFSGRIGSVVTCCGVIMDVTVFSSTWWLHCRNVIAFYRFIQPQTTTYCFAFKVLFSSSYSGKLDRTNLCSPNTQSTWKIELVCPYKFESTYQKLLFSTTLLYLKNAPFPPRLYGRVYLYGIFNKMLLQYGLTKISRQQFLLVDYSNYYFYI